HWLEAHYYWLPEFHAEVLFRTKRSLFHHFWHNVLVRMGIDGNAHPPEGSFMASIFNSGTPRDVASNFPSDIRLRIKNYLSQTWVQEACTKRGILLKLPI